MNGSESAERSRQSSSSPDHHRDGGASSGLWQPGEASGGPVRLTEADNGKAVTVKVGDTSR